jgi:6-pyruvoyltetrahydropterin/6-carboxytetrahydropterin synthase
VSTFISKEVQFDAGHRVPNHSSKCKNPHGHRYRVVVTLGGDLITEKGDSQEGMVIDFGFIKEALTEHIHDVFDHGFIVYDGDQKMLDALSYGNGADDDWKVIVVRYIPTAENLAKDCWARLVIPVANLGKGRVWLENVEVWETPTSMASYKTSWHVVTGFDSPRQERIPGL